MPFAILGDQTLVCSSRFFEVPFQQNIRAELEGDVESI
jgi:hypothetical protein